MHKMQKKEKPNRKNFVFLLEKFFFLNNFLPVVCVCERKWEWILLEDV